MSQRTSTGLALALLAFIAVLGIAALTFIGLTWSQPAGDILSSPEGTVIVVLRAFAFGLVGALIASRRPDNLIGWLFLAAGFYGCLAAFGERYLTYAFLTEPGSVPAPKAALSLLTAAWLPDITAITLLLVLFPTGQATSRYWVGAGWLAVIATIATYVLLTIEPGNLSTPFEDLSNVLGVQGLEDAESVAAVPIAVVLFVTLAASIGMIVRFRRSRGEEREQFKWFAYVASFVPVGLAAHMVSEFVAPDLLELIDAVFALVFVGMPVAVGFAVLKYRLYDVDILINRTLVYVPLTAMLAGLYVAMTGLSRTVFTELSGTGSDAAIAISTLAVVALLTPLKNQLQALVDRYFKEQPDPGPRPEAADGGDTRRPSGNRYGSAAAPLS